MICKLGQHLFMILIHGNFELASCKGAGSTHSEEFSLASEINCVLGQQEFSCVQWKVFFFYSSFGSSEGETGF